MANNSEEKYNKHTNEELLEQFIKYKQAFTQNSENVNGSQSYQNINLGNYCTESNFSTDISSNKIHLPLDHSHEELETVLNFNNIGNQENQSGCVKQTINKNGIKTNFNKCNNSQEFFPMDTFNNPNIFSKTIHSHFINDIKNKQVETCQLTLNSTFDNNFDILKEYTYPYHKQCVYADFYKEVSENNKVKLESNNLNSCNTESNNYINILRNQRLESDDRVFMEKELVQSVDTISDNKAELVFQTPSNMNLKKSIQEDSNLFLSKKLKDCINKTTNLSINNPSKNIQKKHFNFKRKSMVASTKSFDLTTSDSSTYNQATAFSEKKLIRKNSFQNDNSNYMIPQSMMQQKINELISQCKQLEKRITVLTDENKNLKRKNNLNKEGELIELKKRNHELALNASNLQAKLKQLQIQNEPNSSIKRKLSRTSNIVDEGEQVELIKAKYQQLLFQVNSYQNEMKAEYTQDEKKVEESLKISNKERLHLEKDLINQKQLNIELNQTLKEELSYKNMNIMMTKDIENLNKLLTSKEKIAMENIHLKVEIERNEKKLVSINDSLKAKELDHIKSLEEIGKLKLFNEAKDKKLLHYKSIEEQLNTKIENLIKEKELLNEQISSNDIQNLQNISLLKKEILKLKSEKKENEEKINILNIQLYGKDEEIKSMIFKHKQEILKLESQLKAQRPNNECNIESNIDSIDIDHQNCNIELKNINMEKNSGKPIDYSKMGALERLGNILDSKFNEEGNNFIEDNICKVAGLANVDCNSVNNPLVNITNESLINNKSNAISNITNNNDDIAHVFQVLYDYDPYKYSPNVDPDKELLLVANDYVIIYGDLDEDGFYYGELLSGEKGYIPSNFVRKLSAAESELFFQMVNYELVDVSESQPNSELNENNVLTNSMENNLPITNKMTETNQNLKNHDLKLSKENENMSTKCTESQNILRNFAYDNNLQKIKSVEDLCNKNPSIKMLDNKSNFSLLSNKGASIGSNKNSKMLENLFYKSVDSDLSLKNESLKKPFDLNSSSVHNSLHDNFVDYNILKDDINSVNSMDNLEETGKSMPNLLENIFKPVPKINDSNLKKDEFQDDNKLELNVTNNDKDRILAESNNKKTKNIMNSVNRKDVIRKSEKSQNYEISSTILSDANQSNFESILKDNPLNQISDIQSGKLFVPQFVGETIGNNELCKDRGGNFFYPIKSSKSNANPSNFFDENNYGSIVTEEDNSLIEEIENSKSFSLFVALFNYDPSTMSPNEDASLVELAFKEGQIIKIFGEKDEDGFYIGECGGSRGLVPSNIVSEIHVQDPQLQQQLLRACSRGVASSSYNTMTSSRTSSRTRSRTNSRLSDRSRTNSRTSERTNCSSNLNAEIASSTTSSVQNFLEGELRGESHLVIALYNYDPYELSPNNHPQDELCFLKGDVIEVFGPADDDGFFYGRLRQHRDVVEDVAADELINRFGLVPSNFVIEATQVLEPQL